MMLDNIIVTVTGIILTSIGTAIYNKIAVYLKKRELMEKKERARVELHFIKLDAVVYALGTVGDHKAEFEKVYKERYKDLIKERNDIENILNQN